MSNPIAAIATDEAIAWQQALAGDMANLLLATLADHNVPAPEESSMANYVDIYTEALARLAWAAKATEEASECSTQS